MYNYQMQKTDLFTPDGVKTLLKVRDNVERLLRSAGAVTMDKALTGCSGDSWTMMAAVDYLVETGELREITGTNICGQHRVFVAAR